MIAAGRPGTGLDALGAVLPWLGLLVLLVIAGGVAIYLLRRAVGRDVSDVDGFTLQDLRELHASGALSDEEYRRAKAAVIGRISASSGPDDGAGPDAPRP